MYIEILVLAQITVKPRHAYEIRKNINNIFINYKKINNNTLYPLMTQLENNGYIKGSLLIQEGRPNKKEYIISESGRERLHDLLCEFDAELSRNEMELYTRILLLDYLKPVEALKILGIRRDAILNEISFYSSYDSKAGYSFSNEKEMLGVLNKRADSELEFLDQLEKKYRNLL